MSAAPVSEIVGVSSASREEGSATPSPEVLDPSDSRGDVKRNWEKVRGKIMSVVGASLNFHTLRDMYGDIVLDTARLKFVSDIANGNYGRVSQYDYTEHDGTITSLAIKRMRTGDVAAQDLLDFMKEVKILKQLKHTRIAMFRGTGTLPCERQESQGEEDEEEDDDDVFLAQELMEGGTLRAMLEKQKANKRQNLYTLSEALYWLLDVACALAYLHNSEPLVIHRDLKPENIMLTRNRDAKLESEYVAKIVDFGLHKVVERWERDEAVEEDGFYDMTGGTGAYIYMAPEAFRGNRYNHKVDVFSFAIVAWELLHYQLLITKVYTGSAEDAKNYARHVATANHRPKVSSSIPVKLRDLIESMWDKDPEKRPEFNDIIPRLRTICEEARAQELKTEAENQRAASPVRIRSRFFCCFFKES